MSSETATLEATTSSEILEAAGQGPERALRWPREMRLRTAGSAASAMAAVLLPFGLVIGLLLRSFSLFILVVAWSALTFVLSYVGQRQNVVFVGPRGVRRLQQGCDLTLPWERLQELVVRVPGNRIVIVRLEAESADVVKVDWRPTRAGRVLMRHPPSGFDLRLDRHGAELLVEAVRERRPDLPGLADWEVKSRPVPKAGKRG